MNTKQKEFVFLVCVVSYSLVVFLFSLSLGFFNAFELVTRAIIITALITGICGGMVWCGIWAMDFYDELGKKD